ncbi:MAG: hypothetical protein CMB80_17210 [Flammeovirgaceae bacterium]|nr:hypothetical protein [Flammeovirgaceae bacterium]HCX24951.1 hypothetical protein [Cytophagales bacterium]
MKLILFLFGTSFGLMLLKFNQSLSIMYPGAGYLEFLQLFGVILMCIALLSWVIWSRYRDIKLLTLLSRGTLISISVAVTVVGLIVSFDVKTEEFFYYFLLSAVAVGVNAVELIKHILVRKTYMLIFSVGLFGGSVVGSFVPSIAAWIIIDICTIAYCYLNHRHNVQMAKV